MGALHEPAGATNASGPPCLVAYPSVDSWHQPELQRAMEYAQAECAEMSRTPITDSTSSRVQACLTPNRQSSPESANLPVVFLVGDSHASNIIPALAAATRGRAQLVYATVGHGCGFNSDAFMASQISRCFQLRTLIWQTVQAQLRVGDVLVTATAHHRFNGAQDPFDTAFLNSVGQTVAAAGATMIIVGDSPFTANDGTRCTSAASAPSCESTIQWSKSYLRIDEAETAYDQLATANSRVLVYRQHDLFCTSTVCGATIPGTSRIWVYDRQHWTYEGAMYAAPFFACFFDEHSLLPCA